MDNTTCMLDVFSMYLLDVFSLFQFTFDTRVLPKCMFHKDFRIFGIHIWLQNHDSEKMTCPIVLPAQPTGAPKASTINYTNGFPVPTITPQPKETNAARSASSSKFTLFVAMVTVVVVHLRTLGRHVNQLS